MSSSGEILSNPGSRKEIHCDCGNVIEYDDITLNCTFPAYQTLTCDSCEERHRIVADGMIGNVVGAT